MSIHQQNEGTYHHCKSSRYSESKSVVEYGRRKEFYPGGSIDECREMSDGTFILTGDAGWEEDAFVNQVNFCPFCGAEAPVKMHRRY